MWWFLVLKSNGRYEVVNIQCMWYNCDVDKLVTGTKVTLVGSHDVDNSAIIIAGSHDRQAMQRLLPRGYEQTRHAQPAAATQDEDDDFSASDGSSWEPTDSSCSSDVSDTEEHESPNHRITQCFTKSNRVLKPSNQINPKIPNTLPAPTPYVPQRHDSRNDMIENDYAQRLVRLINDLKQKLKSPDPVTPIPIKTEIHNTPNSAVTKSFYEEHPKKKITETPVIKKENIAMQKNENTHKDSKVKVIKKENNKHDWIPIGSGTTLIHKDEYRKINWSSYTKATRTLLLAAFPRQILATHSMTGKKSPAFPNKPAKLCLDQRITEDIILEITNRFDVKKNLVRTIITTKCADECKMMKIQKGKTKIHSTPIENEKGTKINNSKCKIDD